MASFKGVKISADAPPSLVKEWAKSEATKESWGTDEKKVNFATECAAYTHNFIRSLPIGWNLNDHQDKIVAACKEGIMKDVVPNHYNYWAIAGLAFAAILFPGLAIDVLIIWGIYLLINACVRSA